MSLRTSFCLLSLLWTFVRCDLLEEGVLHMECHDRYFMIAVDLAMTGQDPDFEVVDKTGATALTKEYAAECGYTLSSQPFLGVLELRASYFSCNTEKQDNEFVFNFNLISKLGRKETTYKLNKMCPSPVFAHREVSCQKNYMEVSIQHEPTCLPGTSDWDGLRPVYIPPFSDWQVTFPRLDEQLLTMNLTETREKGYLFELKHERIVFRTPYGQPDLYKTEVDDVKVEVVHASLFTRQNWFVIMIDLDAACSVSEGSFDGSYMMWDAPKSLYPSLHSSQMSVGLNGDLMARAVAEQRGFKMDTSDNLIHIGIPRNAEGVYRKSVVRSGLFVLYIYNLDWKQISLDENNEEIVIRYYRALVSPLLPHHLIIENQTSPKEGTFKVFLGNVPEDVELSSIQLNGQIFNLPMTNESAIVITEEAQPNHTFGYTLRVPFTNPVVIQEFSKEYAAMLHTLNINYALNLPGSDPYHHTASITALTNVSPPVFGTNCSKSGITFTLINRSYDHLWKLTIGADLLTLELATERGYIMINNSYDLVLFIPLLTPGYKYKDVSLKGFFGTFEVLVRDSDTFQVQASSVKTCHFEPKEFIMCSTDGMITVAADLSEIIDGGEMPTNFHLNDKRCGPLEVSGTRVLFSYPVNSCGSDIKLSEKVIYENKIFHNLREDESTSGDKCQSMTVECTYPLQSLGSLFSMFTFESDMDGVGKILHNVQTPKDIIPLVNRPVFVRH